MVIANAPHSLIASGVGGAAALAVPALSPIGEARNKSSVVPCQQEMLPPMSGGTGDAVFLESVLVAEEGRQDEEEANNDVADPAAAAAYY